MKTVFHMISFRFEVYVNINNIYENYHKNMTNVVIFTMKIYTNSNMNIVGKFQVICNQISIINHLIIYY